MVRSQIAEAFYNSLTHSRDARSAGVAAIGVDFAAQRAITVMDEVGVSLEGHSSKQVTLDMAEWADKIILFERGNIPPYILESKKVEYWDVEDHGYGQDDSLVLDRATRDDIRRRVEELLKLN